MNREIRSTWRFDHVIATEIEDFNGAYTTAAGGRPVRTKVGSGKDTVNTGDSILILGSSRRDMPMAIGVSPWIVG